MTTHIFHKCNPCENPGNCSYCDGGLQFCTVCGGAEGSLPIECPGVKMTHEQDDKVYVGKLDYKNGVWVET